MTDMFFHHNTIVYNKKQILPLRESFLKSLFQSSESLPAFTLTD